MTTLTLSTELHALGQRLTRGRFLGRVRQLSIRGKLTLITMTSGLVALLFAGVLLATIAVVATRWYIGSQVSVIARVWRPTPPAPSRFKTSDRPRRR